MLFKSCADKSARPHQLIPNLEDRTLNWGTNVFWWYHSSPESSLPPSTAGPCPLSINPRLLVWEVGCQERSPPERGRLRRTLGMRSLPARGLNIVVMGYRADVYIVDYRGSWHNRGRLMFVGWRQALCCWNVRSPPSLSEFQLSLCCSVLSCCMLGCLRSCFAGRHSAFMLQDEHLPWHFFGSREKTTTHSCMERTVIWTHIRLHTLFLNDFPGWYSSLDPQSRWFRLSVSNGLFLPLGAVSWPVWRTHSVSWVTVHKGFYPLCLHVI